MHFQRNTTGTCKRGFAMSIALQIAPSNEARADWELTQTLAKDTGSPFHRDIEAKITDSGEPPAQHGKAQV